MLHLVIMSPCSCNSKSQEELASHYALQVALQTMKERCLQLQARLSILEKENLNLKIEKQKTSRSKRGSHTDTDDIDRLHEQVTELNKQKLQLTEHFHMVTTENKHLWSKLCVLTEANESLGTRLNKISSALNSHRKIYEESGQQIEYDLESQSLEEISLKLFDNMLERKSELEQQYAEMIELQGLEDCYFTSSESKKSETSDYQDSNNENLTLTKDLQRCKKQLLSVLSNLKNQNETCRKMPETMKEKVGSECLLCQKITNDEEKLCLNSNDEIIPYKMSRKGLVNTEVQYCNDTLCPICSESISKQTLVDHVLLHFPPAKINDDDKFDEFCFNESPSVF